MDNSIPDFQETKTLAEQGDARSQAILGEMYYRGLGVQQDYAKAIEWFEKACDNGLEKGCCDYKRLIEAGY